MADEEYPFNDELLVSESDQEIARRLYPAIFPALNHEALRQAFLGIDVVAKAEKKRSRRLGTAAVLLITLALLAASAEPFAHRSAIATILGITSAAFGIGGALLGYFGILFLSSKRRWLVNRFLCERMRQFHFQMIITSVPEIVRAAETGEWSHYFEYRSAELEKLKRDIFSRANSIFQDVITAAEPKPWLFPNEIREVPDTAATRELFEAYDRLRVAGQIRFCGYKLSLDSRFLSSLPVMQENRLTAGAFFCVAGILGLHVAIGMNLITNLDEAWLPPLHLGAICLAIVALALRTLEEGLQPHREVERYRAYRFGLENIERRIGKASDGRDRLVAMVELEELSFGEMVTFLKSNFEARYVM